MVIRSVQHVVVVLPLFVEMFQSDAGNASLLRIN